VKSSGTATFQYVLHIADGKPVITMEDGNTINRSLTQDTPQ